MQRNFESKTGLIDFVAIEEEFIQLQEYVDEILNFTEQKYKIIQNENNSRNFRSAEDFDVYYDEERKWEENVFFIGPSMSLVSLYLFVEKSLKNLCYSFTENSTSWYVEKGVRFKVPKKHDESIIEASLKYLLNTEKFKFKISDDVLKILEKVRVLRNDFSHGDWENVRIIISEINIIGTFSLVGKLFEQIENGMN